MMKQLLIFASACLISLSLTSCGGGSGSSSGGKRVDYILEPGPDVAPGPGPIPPVNDYGDGPPVGVIPDPDDGPDMDGDRIGDVRDIDFDGDGLIEIETYQELNNIRYSMGGAKYTESNLRGSAVGCPESGCFGYEIINDISLPEPASGEGNWIPVGTSNNPYSGTFEGNGNTIYNLKIVADTSSVNTGFFGVSSGTLQNLNIVSASLIQEGDGRDYSAGILAGWNRWGRVYNVSVVDITVNTTNVYNTGGLIGRFDGYSESATIEGIVNSSVRGTVDIDSNSNEGRVGGMVGQIWSGSIGNSFVNATGNIGVIQTPDGSASGRTVGGLVGTVFGYGGVRNSFVRGVTVTAFASLDSAGGLVGENKNNIYNNYVSEDVTVEGGDDNNNVGGLIGVNNAGNQPARSYSLATVSGGSGTNNVGRLIGKQNNGVNNSYYQDDTPHSGGTDNLDLSYGFRRTEEQLKAMTSVAPAEESACTKLGGTWDTTDTEAPVCLGGNYESWTENNWYFMADQYPSLKSFKLDDSSVRTVGDLLCYQNADRVQCPDDDSDGVLNIDDACPDGVTEWTSDASTDYDGDGCQDADDEDLDSDNDGVLDSKEEGNTQDCSKGSRYWKSSIYTDKDGDGCLDVDEDTDHNNNGTDNSTGTDDDGDGIEDEDDICPKGMIDWTSNNKTDYDGDGCQDGTYEDPDRDNDGVYDDNDLCSKGSTGWVSDDTTDNDKDGCQDEDEDKDDDNDGVSDLKEASKSQDCSKGYVGWTSNEITDKDGDGCIDLGEDIDDDNDGVGDDIDNCPENTSSWVSTPESDEDSDGCIDSSEDIDADSDGLIEIRSIAMLNNIRNNLSGTGYNDGNNDTSSGCSLESGCNGYELASNISELSAKISNWIPVGTAEAPFTAEFNGNGNTISGVVISSTGLVENTGFFGVVRGGVIKNLGITEVSVTQTEEVSTSYNVGTIVGLLGSGILDNVYASSATVGSDGTGDNEIKIGGLVGLSVDSIIRNSYISDVTITGGASTNFIGGLAGNNGGLVESSYASDVEITGGSGIASIGGLVGINNDTLDSSYAVGEVTGGAGLDSVGGLVGNNVETISNSYAQVMVAGGAGIDTVGLLVATNSGTVRSIYYSMANTIELANTSGAADTELVIASTGKTDTQLKLANRIAPKSDGECTSAGGTWNTSVPGNFVCENGNYDGWKSTRWLFGDAATYPTLKSTLGRIICNQPGSSDSPQLRFSCPDDGVPFSGIKPTADDVKGWTLPEGVAAGSGSQIYVAAGWGTDGFFSDGTSILDYSSGKIPSGGYSTSGKAHYLPVVVDSSDSALKTLFLGDTLIVSVVDPDINNGDGINYVSILRVTEAAKSRIYNTCSFSSAIPEDDPDTEAVEVSDFVGVSANIFEDKAEISITAGNSDPIYDFSVDGTYYFLIVKARKLSSNSLGDLVDLVESLKTRQGNRASYPQCQRMSFSIGAGNISTSDARKLSLGSGFLYSDQYDTILK